jgi:hypothetical protein
MEGAMDVTGIIAIISTLVIASAIIFSFIYKVKKNRHNIEKLKYQKGYI